MTMDKPIKHSLKERGHKKRLKEYTPENINSLKPNEVFVFGSNLAGHHGGGAARTALKSLARKWDRT